MSKETAQGNGPHRFGTLSLVVFYLLAFGVSWLGFVPAIAGSRGIASFQSALWQGALILPGIGPAVAAGITNALFGPSRRVSAMPANRLKSSFLRPVPFQWWAITVVLSIGIMLVASLVSFSVYHTRILSKASASSVLLFSLMSITANPFEEIGWRGFAQTQLQKSQPALTAAFIVGLLWAVWHVPLFLVSSGPMSMSQTPFWPWAAGVIPQAILLAWLYNRTGQSLGIVSLFHVLGNISGDMLHSSTAVVSAVRIAVALTVIWIAGPRLEQPHADMDKSS